VSHLHKLQPIESYGGGGLLGWRCVVCLQLRAAMPCKHCGETLELSLNSPRRYCDARCRRRAYVARKTKAKENARER